LNNAYSNISLLSSDELELDPGTVHWITS